jgi:hypothetical protein
MRPCRQSNLPAIGDGSHTDNVTRNSMTVVSMAAIIAQDQ